MILRCRRRDPEPPETGLSRYTSAMVLGLNDAIIEMTGALAGFTMSLQENRLILLAGITMGVAATLSMAASEFLAQQSERSQKKPWAAAGATGVTYLFTVALLLLPFCIFQTPMHALAVCLGAGAVVIILFTWIISRIRKTSFITACTQMLAISFSVAVISFLISWTANYWWGVEF